jgi:hypothetical protein
MCSSLNIYTKMIDDGCSALNIDSMNDLWVFRCKFCYRNTLTKCTDLVWSRTFINVWMLLSAHSSKVLWFCYFFFVCQWHTVENETVEFDDSDPNMKTTSFSVRQRKSSLCMRLREQQPMQEVEEHQQIQDQWVGGPFRKSLLTWYHDQVARYMWFGR